MTHRRRVLGVPTPSGAGTAHTSLSRFVPRLPRGRLRRPRPVPQDGQRGGPVTAEGSGDDRPSLIHRPRRDAGLPPQRRQGPTGCLGCTSVAGPGPTVTARDCRDPPRHPGKTHLSPFPSAGSVEWGQDCTRLRLPPRWGSGPPTPSPVLLTVSARVAVAIQVRPGVCGGRRSSVVQ